MTAHAQRAWRGQKALEVTRKSAGSIQKGARARVAMLALLAVLGTSQTAVAQTSRDAESSSVWSLLTEDLSVNVAAHFGLADSDSDLPDSEDREPGIGSQGERSGKTSFAATFKYNPHTYWFASLTAISYKDAVQQQPWDPDFTFVLGYDNWRPGTLSVTYAHYGGNRFNPESDESISRLEEGTLSIGWKLEIPQWFEDLFIVHPTGGLGAAVGLHLTPRYTDLASGGKKEWKKQVTLSFKFSIYKWLYFNATLFYYPDPEQQQPWDPDYTYGFGYFDWHPGTLTVQYNNYSGNRYPGRPDSPGTGRFEDGSLSIAWSWTF